jgi:4'-phosphopantetheinyl transferase
LRRLLDADELARLVALRRQADQERFLVGCALARTALAGYLGRPHATLSMTRRCPRCGRPHGKPRLAMGLRPQIHWSVSHSGDRVLVAFALESSLGVDVEEAAPAARVDQVIHLVLSAREADTLRRLDTASRTRGLLRYWVRKEAVAKAIGEGLSLPFQALTVSGPAEPPRVLSWPDQHSLARVALYDLDMGEGYLASLAVVGEPQHPAMLDGSALLRR